MVKGLVVVVLVSSLFSETQAHARGVEEPAVVEEGPAPAFNEGEPAPDEATPAIEGDVVVTVPPGDTPSPSAPATADERYEALVASLPDDFDIDYRWIPPAKGRARAQPADEPRERVRRERAPRDHSISSEEASRMRVAGGTLLGLGIAATVLSVSVGVPVALTTGGEQAEQAKLAAIAGGSTGGGVFLIGTGLLVAGRKAARENGDLPRKDKAFMELSSKQKGNHTVAAILGLVYGVGGLGGGLGLMLCDCSEGKHNAGKALVTLGSFALAIGTYAAIRLGVDKVRRQSSARLYGSPMFVRGGAGGQLGLRW